MTSPLLIVVPVMRRPRNALHFMTSLNRSVDEWMIPDVMAVADPGDHQTINAWRECGAHVLVSDLGHTFAAKMQCAYEELPEPNPQWLLLIGDDVEFKQGWVDEALKVMADERVGLIATNDLHNPFVVTGQHATHPIIRRSWIAEHGASWDGPGTIAHRGYHHAFVDAEWTAVAQQGGVFAFAPDCMIEHLHPTWGKSMTDRVYRLGMAHYEQDRRLFEARKARYTCES